MEKRVAYWLAKGYVKQANPLADFMAEHPLEVPQYIDVPEKLASNENRTRWQGERARKGEQYTTQNKGYGIRRIWRVK